MAEQNLKEKTANGLLWGAVSNGVQQILNLVFGILLARLLLPEDYGMVGMLTIFSLIAASLQESGFISALNRKEETTQADYNAVFWFNILCSSGIYILLFLCAPLIAEWFHEPKLTALARFSFLSFVISSLGTTPRAYLFRHLKVKQTAWMSLAALFISGTTGVLLAWQGFAYWGIAVQNLTFCAMVTLFSWYFSGWRPSRHIDLRPLRGMIGFSSKLLITNIFNHINNNIFAVFFGRLYGDRMVGYYNQANKWTYMGHSLLSNTLWGVTQPVFARLENDREREWRAFRKMLRFTAFTSFPILLGIALIAPEFITILITEKWLPSARLMQILCVGGAFIPVASLYSNVLISQGRSNVFMWNTIGLCLLQLLALLILYPFGVKVMVTVYVALGILWLPVWHYFVQRLIGLTLWQALTDIMPFLLSAIIAVTLAYGATLFFSNCYAVISVKITVAVAVYVSIMAISRVTVFYESLKFLIRRRT